eukprot:TRINITY_DN843_c0_g1_i1.p1 TRINITY_DN843_c0_g1~~TRINITY_DN843_c0_g1_i1.p1  ORF type:complete len:373 (+),score=100.27 TRINITY_DN843_c0_g1_i1:84-1202(+)
MAGVTRFVAPHLASASYSGVEPLEAIAKEIGIKVEDLIKLNANENVYGAPNSVIDAIAKVDHHVYPDPAQVKLRQALADMLGLKRENICCGAGSDDILDITIRMVCPSAIVTSIPTFGMYKFLGSVANINVVNVPRREDFNIDVDDIIAAIRENKATVVFLASPNNPTGTLVSNSDVERLCKEEAIIVIDEAYAEFCDVTAMDLFGKYDNLVVSRTFSKWAGLAGLRLGYCAAHPDLIKVMLAIKQPYNVTTATEAAGLAALECREDIMKTVTQLRQEKDRMYKALSEFAWLEPVSSDANFLLIKVLRIPAKQLYDALRKRGIIIRFFGSQGGDLHNYVRISAGKPSDTDAVLNALKEIEQEEKVMATTLSL